MISLILFDLKQKKLILLSTAVLLLMLNVLEAQEETSLITNFLFIMPVIMIMILLVKSVQDYSHSLSGYEGYLFFLLPLNGYQIILSRLFSSLLQLLIIYLTFFLSSSFMFDEVADMKITLGDSALSMSSAVTVYVLILFALTLTQSLLKQVRGKGLISVVIAVVLISIFLHFNSPERYDLSETMLSIFTWILAALVTTATGYLLDKKINL